MSVSYNYFITHGRGTFKFVETELITYHDYTDPLTGKNISLNILDSIEGKMFFATNAPVHLLHSFKTVERVCLSILFKKFENLPNQQEIIELVKQAFESNQNLFSSPQFNSILDSPSESEARKKITKEINFRVNCKLTGSWKLLPKFGIKKDLIELINRSVKSVNGHFEPNQENNDFEVICHLTDLALSIGMPISLKPLSNRSYIQHVGLRSTICSIMLQMADATREFTFILDPFCGKGTILAEYINSCFNRACFIGSDTDSTQIKCAHENIIDSYTKQVPDLIISNLTATSGRLPYRDNTFDLVVTDLPFEKKHLLKFFDDATVASKRETFYQCVLKEFNRLLDSESGVLVVLINSDEIDVFLRVHSQLRDSLKKFLRIESNSVLSLGQTTGQVFRLIR